MKNIVFYFTGTGNSLKIARDIANELGDCEIKLITNFEEKVLASGYERIGFVFPVYCASIPNCLSRFLSDVDFSLNSDAYFFAVSTQGGGKGNSLYDVKKLLQQQNIELNAAFDLKMFSNYIVLYAMKEDVAKINEPSSHAIVDIAKQIKAKEDTNTPNRGSLFLKLIAKALLPTLAKKDRHFNISSGCDGCGICEKVCAVKNIALVDGTPTFKHHCEQCVACIQTCPKQAINYKQLTQNRGRYLNPEITINDLFVDGK